MLQLAERDPAKFAKGLRETWESLTEEDREMFNPSHRCDPDCWHKQVPAWNPSESIGAYGQEMVHGVIRSAARFLRRKFL